MGAAWLAASAVGQRQPGVADPGGREPHEQLADGGGGVLAGADGLGHEGDGGVGADLTAVEREIAEDAVQQGGLADAVGPDERGVLARPDAERHVARTGGSLPGARTAAPDTLIAAMASPS